MPDNVTPPDPGILSSLANQLALPGYMVRNILTGNPEGSVRNLIDFGGNIIDAAIPFVDAIPEVSTERDRPEFRDVVSTGDGITGDILNFAGNVATDPLTFVPGAAIAKGAGAVGKGVKAVSPKVVREGASKALKAAQPALKKVRKTFGAQKISTRLADAVTKAQAAKEVAGQAAQEGVIQALKGATKKDLIDAGNVANNIMPDAVSGVLKPIDKTGLASLQDRVQKYVMENPDVDADKLLRIVSGGVDVGKAEWASGISKGTIGGNIFKDIGQSGIKDYTPHVFKREMPEDILDEILSNPNASMRRELDTPQKIIEHLTKNKDVSLENNFAKILGNRAIQQGELASRAAMGRELLAMAKEANLPISDEVLARALEKIPKKEGDELLPTGGVPTAAKPISGLTDIERQQARDYLFSQEFALADPIMKAAAKDIAQNLAGDEADVALHFLQGMQKRGWMTNSLSKLNRYFKPYAVYGAVIPKLGSITRNLTGGLWQQFSNAEARGSVGQAAKRLIPNWISSIEDGVEKLVGKRLFTKNEFAEVENAFKQAGGDPRRALELVSDPTMRSAVENGIFGNNFVDMEQLILSASKGGWRSFGKNLVDYPGAMFKGAEQRMRYGLFKDLVTGPKKMDPLAAAKVVRDTFYDYTISSAENRLARDIIPFFQFSAKAIPQQAKLMVEKPAVASTLANLYAAGRDEPVSPYMEGKVNIPIGTDEQGNKQYITNLGLPFEALGMVPNISASPLQAGRDVEQNIIGSLQPLLKTAYSYTAGRDPYFGTPPGSYTKVAGQDLGDTGSVINQLLNSGMPFASAGQGLVSLAGKATSDQTSTPEALANLLTGARVSSVDPDRAIQQRLQSYLERRPDIGQYRVFFSREGDDEAAQLLQNLKDAKKALKEKQQAITPVN